MWLESLSVTNNIGQVLHLIAAHGQLSGGSCGVDILESLEPGDHSNSLGNGKQLAVVTEIPSLVVPRSGGLPAEDFSVLQCPMSSQ